jgi:hypothetical protein
MRTAELVKFFPLKQGNSQPGRSDAAAVSPEKCPEVSGRAERASSDNSSAAQKTKKVGRPSMKDIIVSAYNSLKETNQIDFLGTQKSACSEVLQYLIACGAAPNNSKTPEPKTIAKHIGSLFETEKARVSKL